jgi:hypothetical protein
VEIAAAKFVVTSQPHDESIPTICAALHMVEAVVGVLVATSGVTGSCSPEGVRLHENEAGLFESKIRMR